MRSSQNNIVLQAENISRQFDGIPILSLVNLNVEKGKIVTLLGQSGSGKTTLFNILAGLDTPDKGKVTLFGKDITATPGYVAYMLQKDLLLKHLKIIDNVSLPLRLNGKSKSKAREIAKGYFEEFGLKGTELKYPSALSGGMAQRAAFLRTFLFSKELILLDEPFSKLDAITKMNLQNWYLDIKEKYGLTTVFITHDIDEALRMSDEVHVLSPKLKDIGYSYRIEVNNRESFFSSEEYFKTKRAIQQAILNT